ncbi:MAG: AI-2E family transporter [Candidatus Moraniibacteriota bacterium]|nr:MAG: AI-2E family transporter [Candidatus Moranbacteria bacterium]
MNKITISPSILWWATGIVLGVWFLYVIRDIIVLFFVALIISAAMEPAIRKLQNRFVNRSAAVIVVFISLLIIVAGILWSIIPMVINEIRSLAEELPIYAKELTGSEVLFEDISRFILSSFENGFGQAGVSQEVFSKTVGVIGSFVSFFAILSMAFYLSIREDGVQQFLRSLLPKKYQGYIISRSQVIYEKIGRWMLGQFILMFIVFVLYYAVLLVFGVPNALVLAILGGALEIIPYFGPVLAAIPAIVLAFFVSPLVGLLVAISFGVIQQIENHILVPQVMRKVLGLNPVVIILALFVGGSIAGVSGMILAVPFVMGLRVFVKDVIDAREKENNKS